ncbi:MAG: hypothetical protein QOD03_466, partial [Verrucomicrobiota bacterium]
EKLLRNTGIFKVEGFCGHEFVSGAGCHVSGGKRSSEFGSEFGERLRHDGGAAEDGHKVRVAVPARDDVNMQMFVNARTRAFTEVNADVEAIRIHHMGQSILASPRELHQVGEFFFGEVVQRIGLLVGNDHQMAAGVRIFIKQRKTGAVADDDIVGFVIGRLGNAREHAFVERGFGRQDIFDTPRGVQRFHAHKLVTEQGKVKKRVR